MSKRLRTIAFTPGDANGIGPEVTLKALSGFPPPAGTRWALVGPAAVWRREPAARGLADWPETRELSAAAPAARRIIWDPGIPAPAWHPGRVRADAARAALAAITSAVQAARRGELDAVVTAPICKEGFARAGFPWPGHTELLRELTGARRVGMMLLGGPLRVALATRHVPLRDVPDALTAGALREAIELADGGARWLGLRGARIAVCGLNPHAGDGGALGAEERTRIAPAIRAAVRRGVRAAGPIPGDVAFYQAARGDYAVVVAMYHDQGLAPLKLVGFETGVNLTLGLPILRTSPDHGVAYDLAGRDRADPRSTRAALDLALRLAGRANPWRQ